MKKSILFLSFLWILTNTFATLGAREPSYSDEITNWRKQRLINLRSEDGYPALVGLFWLKEGTNRIGSKKDLEAVLPEGAPAMVGTAVLENGSVRFEPAAGAGVKIAGKPVSAPVKLVSDKDPKVEPTYLTMGSITFFVIERGDKIGLRVRDKNSPARKRISKLDYFAIDPTWRIKAKFEPYNPPHQIQIVNVLGMTVPQESPGALVFQAGGKDLRLDVFEEDSEKEKEFFVIFADETNGKETYGAGRYMYTAMPDVRGFVILDFNKAYNPPCAFTNFATCPLPPKQNRIPLAVQVGEKYSKALHP